MALKDCAYPEIVESFGRPKLEAGNIISSEPSVFNGVVSVERFKLTIERIEENPEVYRERLQCLLQQRLHPDNRRAIKDAAKRLGVDL
jgi:hypothetical protein